MEPAPNHAFYESLPAAMPQLSEKPHQGVPSSNPALYLGHEVSKSTTALGLRAAEHLERIRSRYTGKERDAESGNDYFGARYYSSSLGRFMSPDWSAKEEPIPYAKLDDPQTLNLYAYVENNPMDRVDPDGHVNPCALGACGIGQRLTETLVRVYNLAHPQTIDLPNPKAPGVPSSGAEGHVNYHGHTVSDTRLTSALPQSSSIDFGGSVMNIVSGDRNFVPHGGARHSAHLTHQAADLHVAGQTDSNVDARFKSPDSPMSKGFRVIQHGPYTVTEAAHIHVDTRNADFAPQMRRQSAALARGAHRLFLAGFRRFGLRNRLSLDHATAQA
jgi:RHS repeat-associated protein